MTSDQTVRVDDQGVAALSLGTPTSIGSLPHTDRDAAVAFVLDRLPELPAAPSLPRLDPREGMLGQAAWGVAGVTVGADGALRVDAGLVDPEAPLGDPGLSGAPFATLRAFLAAVAGRTGPLKLQLTGPVTLGAALHRAGLGPDVAFAVAATAVRERVGHLAAAAAVSVPAAPLVVFLDEPELARGFGTGGVPMRLDAALDLVSGALASVEPHGVTGVHCCGPADWPAILQAGPQVVSLPVGAGVTPAAGALAAFVERGGWVAWGAVPTDGPLGESAVRLWRVLSGQWCELVQAGCDPVLLRHQALITPECGLALHTEVQADHVFDLTRRVAERLEDQVANVRLSVGA